MIVTLEVGPRIIRFGVVDGPNEFVEYDKDMGKTGGDEYRSYGGHRLWIAPEERPKTYTPDNSPVEYTLEGETHIFTAPAEPWLVQKEVRITPDQHGFVIEHRIYNRNVYAIELAPWALTVMAAGGVCVFPQPPYGPQPQNLLPVRPMAIWSYTNMSDPRWTWGKKVTRLAQTEDEEPQKIGAQLKQGIAGYFNHGNFFYKRFPFEDQACYPDYGCNFETFTRKGMLEIESLAPLQTVEPGSYAHLVEHHRIVAGLAMPESDDDCSALLNRYSAQ